LSGETSNRKTTKTIMKNCREMKLEGRKKFVEELAAQALEDFRSRLGARYGETEATWCRHHLAKTLLEGELRPKHAKEWEEIGRRIANRYTTS